MERIYTVGCPFGGLGGGALGFIQEEVRVLGVDARFRSVGGIDIDQLACEDFEAFTGTPELCADIATLTVEQLREHWGPNAPDVVFLSAPCKGASGLLSAKKARTAKYRKLNRLSLDWIRLMLAAYPDKPPRFVLFENVPRLKQRAGRMLRAVRGYLREAGYLFTDGFHDCGELGGLAQIRRRFLLVARHAESTTQLLYQPPKKRVRACGEVLSTLPMPTTPEAAEYGRIHELPKLSWLNWVRLALIPAGGDWRDLPGVLEKEQTRREVHRRHHVEDWEDPSVTVAGSGSNGPSGVADPRIEEQYRGRLGVRGFTNPAATVTGNARPVTGRFSVADPRPFEGFADALGVRPWHEPSGTVTGQARPSTGRFSVADPRAFKDGYGVRSFGEPSGTITDEASVSGGTFAVADPRVRPIDVVDFARSGMQYDVRRWDDPAQTVTGAGRVGSGAPSVGDPRARNWFGNVLRVVPWDKAAGTVTGGNGPTNGGGVVADPRVRVAYDHGYAVLPWAAPSFTIAGGSHPGQGSYSVADPRVTSEPRAGAYGVIPWREAAKTVTGSASIDNGAFAVADPRFPDAPPLMVIEDVRKAPPAVPVIISEDETWHRPLTTLELAALQGLPTRMRDGSPLKLAGDSQSAWRERIGNAVPPPAARAIARQMLIALVHADMERMALSGDLEVWVEPETAEVRA